MSYTVVAGNLRPLTLNETDTVKSVMQNISIILVTALGSVPLYRHFGLSQKFVDKPIPVAKTMLYAVVKEAVEEFEPRAKVLGITFATDESVPGKLIPTVEVEISDE